MCVQQRFAPVRQNAIAQNTTKSAIHKISVFDGFGVWVPATQVSAARIGLAKSPEDAAQRRIADHFLRLNFPRFAGFTFGEKCKADADDRAGILVSSSRDDVVFPTALYGAAYRAGWTRQIVLPRQQGRGEKGVDTTVALVLVKATVLRDLDPAHTEVSIIGCDKDHIPAIEMLNEYGFLVDVLGWRHATSRAMIEAATGRFVALDDFFDQLTFRKMVH